MSDTTPGTSQRASKHRPVVLGKEHLAQTIRDVLGEPQQQPVFADAVRSVILLLRRLNWEASGRTSSFEQRSASSIASCVRTLKRTASGTDSLRPLRDATSEQLAPVLCSVLADFARTGGAGFTTLQHPEEVALVLDTKAIELGQEYLRETHHYQGNP